MDYAQTESNTGRKTILIVEDSPVQAFAMISLLEEKGLKVLCAPDGSSGVALAKRTRPDLIILDIQMPVMDGLEACQLIKQDPAIQDVPVIFLTAHTETDVLFAGVQHGAVDFIPKDAFSDLVLLKTLQELNLMSSADLEEAK